MNRNRHNTSLAPTPGAFTLIELLTIIIILGMLITMSAPSILEARKIAKTQESRAYLHTISGAIGTFAAELGKLPPSDGDDWPEDVGSRPNDLRTKLSARNLTGRHALVEALTGYLGEEADLKEGRGVRKLPRGKVYGPYVGPGQPVAGSPPAFTDAFSNEIYYYRYDRVAKSYNTNHNKPPVGPTNLVTRYLLDANQSFYRRDYVLITKGADRQWETFPAGVKKTDDIANFAFQFP